MSVFGNQLVPDNEVNVGEGLGLTLSRLHVLAGSGNQFLDNGGGVYLRTSDGNTATVRIDVYTYDQDAVAPTTGDGNAVDLFAISELITVTANGSDINDQTLYIPEFNSKWLDVAQSYILVLNVITATSPVWVGTNGTGFAGINPSILGDAADPFVYIANIEKKPTLWANFSTKAPIMTTLIDNLVEAGLTALSSHTADTSETYLNPTGVSALNNLQITAPPNRLQLVSGSPGAGFVVPIGALISADMVVRWTQDTLGITSGNNGTGAVVRYSDSTNEGYRIFSRPGNNDVRIQKYIGGSLDGQDEFTNSAVQSVGISYDFQVTITDNGSDVDFVAEFSVANDFAGPFTALGTLTDAGAFGGGSAPAIQSIGNFGPLAQDNAESQFEFFGADYTIASTGSPTLTDPYDARSDKLGDVVSIPSKFTGATSYDAQDLPDGCSINTSTGEITGTVKSPIAGVPTVIAKNESTLGVLAAIPWDVFDPMLSTIAVAAGVVTFDAVTIAADTAVYLSPFGLITATRNNGLVGTVDGSGSDLIINGITIVSPAVLYLSPAGVLTDQPNGDPVANFN